MKNKITIVVEDDTTELDIDDNLVKEWIDTYKKYSTMLIPNKKTVTEVIEYMKLKYPMVEYKSKKYTSVVINNITMNETFSNKIPARDKLNPLVFVIKNESSALDLYNMREDIYKDVDIIVGMESETGFVSVEGSKELSDEVTAFHGLDSDDLTNFYLVSNYVRCLKKYNKLDKVLSHLK